MPCIGKGRANSCRVGANFEPPTPGTTACKVVPKNASSWGIPMSIGALLVVLLSGPAITSTSMAFTSNGTLATNDPKLRFLTSAVPYEQNETNWCTTFCRCSCTCGLRGQLVSSVLTRLAVAGGCAITAEFTYHTHIALRALARDTRRRDGQVLEHHAEEDVLKRLARARGTVLPVDLHVDRVCQRQTTLGRGKRQVESG